MRTCDMVGHLDCDSFYASAERVRRSVLRGKAVGVLGNQGSVTIAKSYEMKAKGVATGMPIWEAATKCPDGIYVQRDFRWYEVLSKKLLAAMEPFSPTIQYYSIDEFFFLAVCLPGKTFQQTAETIRDRMLEETGLPVTVGIAKTQTLAKLISDSAKPFGAKALIDDDAVAELLKSQTVTEIAGIAKGRASRLEPWGITTCYDLAQADRGLIRELLTSSGEELWWELNGERVKPIHTQRKRHKTLSRGGSFGEPVTSPLVLWAWLVRNMERLIEVLEYHKLCAGKLAVWVGYRNGQFGEGRAKLPTPSQRFTPFLEVARPCLRSAYIPKVPAGRMHLFATDLVPRSRVQLGLFDRDESKNDAIAAVKHSINERHGRFKLRSAVTLVLLGLYDDDYFEVCDIPEKWCF